MARSIRHYMEERFLKDRFIWLEAVDRERNIARRYTIALTGDLFGSFIIEYGWGRIGTRGQTVRLSCSDYKAATDFIDRLLRKRAGAPRRIGVPYQEVANT